MRFSFILPLVAGAALLAACGGDNNGPSPLQPNVAPTPRFSFSCAGLTCAFGDQSYDGEAGGLLVAYTWDFGDGGTSPERNPSHTYAAEGMYTVALTVTDDGGGRATISRQVGPALSGRPVISFTVTCAGLACNFTADIPSDVVSPRVRWDFGDGATSRSLTPAHTYEVTEPTDVTVTLEVADFDVPATVAVREITVAPGAP
jgi:PKD repeat protein